MEQATSIYEQVGNKSNFTLVAGNCVLEDEGIALETAKFISELVDEHNCNIIPIFKASFKKDNRSSVEFYHGVSTKDATRIFKEIKSRYNLPILTDFSYLHDLNQELIDVVDVVQLPAYLCMQTELTLGLAKLNRPINLKKGQFLAPSDIEHVINKVKYAGNTRIIITERGASFGYHDLVVDPRSIHILRTFGFPVLIDAGHAVRKYGIPSCDVVRGGCKEYILPIAKAGIAAGATGVFIEAHPNPEQAQCDAATQLNFEELESLLERVIPIWRANSG